MSMGTPELSVVIVNHRTRSDLENCLRSIFDSVQHTPYAVWVVDNASDDGSPEMVERAFPQVHLVANRENVGFARANNQALGQIDTDFVLLLNPDTLVTDHAFDRPIAFLRARADVGMVSCRLVKADGTLDLACRRSFPNAFDGFCRASGLSALFPRSPRLARYNLTFHDEHETVEVDAVNGAFMMVRREALGQVGLLDEEYFMYMEDLDWCRRFHSAGWKIFYHPDATIVHLKGQSGKQSSGRMIRAFFQSMELFCRKHYRPHLSWGAYALTVAGIRAWMHATLWRNALRADKRVTP